MKTVRKYLRDRLISMIVDVPVSALVAGILLFFFQVLFNVQMGGFLFVWKWTYVGIITFSSITSAISHIDLLWKIVAFSKRNDVKLVDVEEAIWVHKLLKEHPDFFSWNSKKFEDVLMVARMARDVSEAVMRAFRKL